MSSTVAMSDAEATPAAASTTTSSSPSSSLIPPAAVPSPPVPLASSSTTPVPYRSAGTPLVEVGSLVLVYSSPTNMCPLVVTPGKFFQNQHGSFPHSSFVKRPFGSRVYAPATRKQLEQGVTSPNSGYVVLLSPTPSLWTRALTHRTQILYSADISFIVMMLDLRPGAFVFESGTGSGSLTTAMTHAVRANGHVCTFEFNDVRAAKARDDFQNFKWRPRGSAGGTSPTIGTLTSLAENVTVFHRDICRNGFPNPATLFRPENLNMFRTGRRDGHSVPQRDFGSFIDLNDAQYQLDLSEITILGEDTSTNTVASPSSSFSTSSAASSSSAFRGVDGVVLDLPSPWSVVRHVYGALRNGGRVCSFSPCIEQVQRCAAAMENLRWRHSTADGRVVQGGFTQIRTFEVLITEYSVSHVEVPLVWKEDHGSNGNNKRKFDGSGGRGIGKREKVDREDDGGNDAAEEPPVEDEETKEATHCPPASASATSRMMIVTRGNSNTRGHTGYLTFAVCLKPDDSEAKREEPA